MILCNHNCIPCCDFCIYVRHSYYHEYDKDGKVQLIKGGPIACVLHNDEEHKQIASSCGQCEDFHCFNVKEEIKNDT